jgi:predicted dienelactone hydrolase
MAGSAGAGGQAGAGLDAGMVPTGPATGTFPAIADPWMPGPFTVAIMPGAGPSGDATVLYPNELGMNGLKHPIVVWDNGAGQTGLGIYQSILQHLASHGFAVYAAYSATDQGTEMTQGIDWMIMQADASGSPFYQKLDVTKVATMGHSQGSIATFATAGDKRLTTTIHLSGGTNPDIAQGHATLANLHNPAAFICGEVATGGADGLFNGDTASEWCAYDFDHTDVPVFLAQITGASHITAPGMTLGACVGWLRWHLMADTTQRAMFAGPDCALCTRPNWMCKEKNL